MPVRCPSTPLRSSGRGLGSGRLCVACEHQIQGSQAEQSRAFVSRRHRLLPAEKSQTVAPNPATAISVAGGGAPPPHHRNAREPLTHRPRRSSVPLRTGRTMSPAEIADATSNAAGEPATYYAHGRHTPLARCARRRHGLGCHRRGDDPRRESGRMASRAVGEAPPSRGRTFVTTAEAREAVQRAADGALHRREHEEAAQRDWTKIDESPG